MRALLAALLLVPAMTTGQTVTGTLQGTITDTSGAVLPGSTVTATNRDTGQERVTVANEVGYYVVPFLPIGNYDVGATLSGFQSIVRQNVAVTLNETLLLDPSILGATIADPATSASVLAASKFRSAQFGELDGIVGRNTFFGDGVRTTDLALMKAFRFATSQSLTVRFEAFNAFNRVQYGFPTADLANVSFGRLLSGANTYAPRALQVGVQYKF